MKITVLWEDARGVGAKGFGPHELLLAALADRRVPLDSRDGSWWSVREDLSGRVIANPRKGAGNLRRTLTEHARRLEVFGATVAVFDRDRVHELWKGDESRRLCMTGVKELLREEGAAEEAEIVFLKENMESLLQALPDPPSAGEKPNPNERDRLLLRYSFVPSQRTLRDGILDRCPSFERIVTKVERMLGAKS